MPSLPRVFIAAGLLLGIGLGGFVDGILFHQILQWHHMLTAEGSFPANTVVGLEDNTLWDGLFHSLTWVSTLAGVILLWNSVPVHRPGWGFALSGLLLAGWGLFNLVEGIVDHHILGIHHVRDDIGAPLGWDLAFLGLGVALLVGGYMLVRLGQVRDAASETPRASRRMSSDVSNS